MGKIILVILTFISSLAYALPAEDVQIINNRDYFQGVHRLLQDARQSIYIIMFSMHYYDRYPDSPSNVLLRDLIDAKKKGVEVKVILEQGEPVSSGLFQRKIQPEEHYRVIQLLEQNGIPYVLDRPDITTHAKLIIVDSIYTIIGSTNWSYNAIAKNNETAVIIKSTEVARGYIEYFNRLLDQ